MKTGTAVSYAVKRIKDHLLRFDRLYDQVRSGEIDEPGLGEIEGRDNIFPDINPDYFK
jgi:1,4-alpha-glucan branching enzyme